MLSSRLVLSELNSSVVGRIVLYLAVIACWMTLFLFRKYLFSDILLYSFLQVLVTTVLSKVIGPTTYCPWLSPWYLFVEGKFYLFRPLVCITLSLFLMITVKVIIFISCPFLVVLKYANRLLHVRHLFSDVVITGHHVFACCI